jgi:hypothetical protein
LVVDPDGVLALAVTRQGLKTIARRRPQVDQIARGMEVPQFATRYLHQIGWKAFGSIAVEDGSGKFVPEAPDHDFNVSLNDTSIKAAPRLVGGECRWPLPLRIRLHRRLELVDEFG